MYHVKVLEKHIRAYNPLNVILTGHKPVTKRVQRYAGVPYYNDLYWKHARRQGSDGLTAQELWWVLAWLC